MPVLYFMRHAQAADPTPESGDFARVLTYSGTQAAAQIGDEMARRKWVPQRVVYSPAARTTQTWQIVASHLGVPAERALANPELYNILAGRLLDILRETDEDAESLLVIGHNPALQELAIRLSGDASDISAFSMLQQAFAPGSVARFEFTGSWRELNPWQPRLTHFLRPAFLRTEEVEQNRSGP